MKIAYLIFDDRVDRRLPEPVFGASPTALLQGLSGLYDPAIHVDTIVPSKEFFLDLHVISCLKVPLPAPRIIFGNIHFHPLTIPGHLFLRSAYLGPITAVLHLLRTLQPDIVHAQGTESWCGWVGSHCPFPKILTLHGNVSLINLAGPMKPFGYWLAQEVLESLSLPKYDQVFCNSEYSRRGAATASLKTRLMSNPIRKEFFAPLPKSPTLPPIPVLLNIGVVQERKRQVELCRMAIRLHREGRRFVIRFIGFCGVGPGYPEKFQQILQEAQELGCAEYVGEKSAAELVDEMDSAAALIHFPREEAFGLVVAEALARNLKIFAADVGGIPDIIQGTEDAELFAPEAWDHLRNRIAAWLKSKTPRPAGGAEIARRRFHPEVIAKAHLAAYLEVMATSPINR